MGLTGSGWQTATTARLTQLRHWLESLILVVGCYSCRPERGALNEREDEMTANTTTPPEALIPPDDARRKLTMANPEDPNMRHISVAGGTYTILGTGEQTGGRYRLIDIGAPTSGP